MESHISLIPLNLDAAEAALSRVSSRTASLGLSLTPEQIRSLTESEAGTLKAQGRIEFGNGILPRLALAFCDSADILPQDWADTLSLLQEAFYTLKSDSRERLTDDTLLALMRKVFDGPAGGSAEYLAELTAKELCELAGGSQPPYGSAWEEEE